MKRGWEEESGEGEGEVGGEESGGGEEGGGGGRKVGVGEVRKKGWGGGMQR